MMMHTRIQDQALVVESLRFTARLEGGSLVSIVDRETGRSSADRRLPRFLWISSS
jgi:hypothetical protein